MKYDKKVLNEMVESGSSKDEIIFHLMMNEKVPHSKVASVLKENNISFKRKAGNWDCIIDYFTEVENPSKEGMIERLQTEMGMTEDQSKKYGSSYWYVLEGIYKINNS